MSKAEPEDENAAQILEVDIAAEASPIKGTNELECSTDLGYCSLNNSSVASN